MPEKLQVAYLSTYVPQECGIATFTEDLLRGVGADRSQLPGWVLAMNDGTVEGGYPPEVVQVVREDHPEDYLRVADWVNDGPVNLVSVQHEFGIYGGEDGSYLLEFLRRLKKPAVATLHTVLSRPTPGQHRLLRQVAAGCELVVVMSRKASVLLAEVYDVPRAKVAVVPHGVPPVPSYSREEAKRATGLAGRRVILTFGLLSPGKGVEYMLEALPPLVERYPDLVYLVAGHVHPKVRRRFGDGYRRALEEAVARHHLERHVRFDPAYLDKERLVRYLVAADVIVTPYLSVEQIVSGALTYAVGFGRAVVSTPFYYATDILAKGRGLLVGFRDSRALTLAVHRVLGEPGLQKDMEERAARYGEQLGWPRVGARYMRIFQRVAGQAPLAVPGSRGVAG